MNIENLEFQKLIKNLFFSCFLFPLFNKLINVNRSLINKKIDILIVFWFLQNFPL